MRGRSIRRQTMGNLMSMGVQPAEQALQFRVAQAAGVGERRQHPAGITAGEGAGLAACLGVIAGVSLLLYGVYRLTLRKACQVTIDGA